MGLSLVRRTAVLSEQQLTYNTHFSLWDSGFAFGASLDGFAFGGGCGKSCFVKMIALVVSAKRRGLRLASFVLLCFITAHTCFMPTVSMSGLCQPITSCSATGLQYLSCNTSIRNYCCQVIGTAVLLQQYYERRFGVEYHNVITQLLRTADGSSAMYPIMHNGGSAAAGRCPPLLRVCPQWAIDIGTADKPRPQKRQYVLVYGIKLRLEIHFRNNRMNAEINSRQEVKSMIVCRAPTTITHQKNSYS